MRFFATARGRATVLSGRHGCARGRRCETRCSRPVDRRGGCAIFRRLAATGWPGLSDRVAPSRVRDSRCQAGRGNDYCAAMDRRGRRCSGPAAKISGQGEPDRCDAASARRRFRSRLCRLAAGEYPDVCSGCGRADGTSVSARLRVIQYPTDSAVLFIANGALSSHGLASLRRPLVQHNRRPAGPLHECCNAV